MKQLLLVVVLVLQAFAHSALSLDYWVGLGDKPALLIPLD